MRSNLCARVSLLGISELPAMDLRDLLSDRSTLLVATFLKCSLSYLHCNVKRYPVSSILDWDNLNFIYGWQKSGFCWPDKGSNYMILNHITQVIVCHSNTVPAAADQRRVGIDAHRECVLVLGAAAKDVGQATVDGVTRGGSSTGPSGHLSAESPLGRHGPRRPSTAGIQESKQSASRTRRRVDRAYVWSPVRDR